MKRPLSLSSTSSPPCQNRLPTEPPLPMQIDDARAFTIETRGRMRPPFSATASKASAGAMEHARLCRVTNLATALAALKKQGVWITGLDPKGAASIYQMDFKVPLGLVVGGEQKGLRPLIKKHCDFLAHIPQKGPIASLNASVAGAVVMYEVFRQKVPIP